MEVAKEIKDTDLEARALNNIGYAYQSLKKAEQAIDYYNRSLAVSQASQNFKMVFITANTLSTLYRNASQYQKAIEVYQQVARIAEKSGDREQQVDAQLNIAFMSLSLPKADYQAIIEQTQQTLKLAQAAKYGAGVAQALAILADVHKWSKNYPQAINYYQQAVEASLSAKVEWRAATVLNTLGDFYRYFLEDDKLMCIQAAI